MTDKTPWSLVGFEAHIDRWIEMESPLDELRLVVFGWALSRHQAPHQGARRVPGFGDLWQAIIPASEHFDDRAEWCAVVVTFWIDAVERSVRCDSVVSLSLPIED